jgi:hypothetical protein
MEILGLKNQNISDHLKVIIIPAADHNGNMGPSVCGLLGEGTSRELTQNWAQPFASDTLKSAAQSAGGTTGAMANMASRAADYGGKTLTTVMNSRQVWESGQHSLNLMIKFQAFSDAYQEVMRPLKALEEMASPDMEEFSPVTMEGIGGRQPLLVDVNVGRITLFTDLTIHSISIPLDTEKDKDGNLVRASVNISLQPIQLIPKRNIAQTWP